MKIVDTHIHLLYPDRFSYGWCNEVPALQGKPFRLEEFSAAAKGTGIARGLFMEVDVDEPQMSGEARFFLELAEAQARGSCSDDVQISGVIAAARPEREDFDAQLDRILHPRLRGIRRVLHTQRDGLCEESSFIRNVSVLAKHNLAFDLCLLARQLPRACKLLSHCSNVQFVLDHCGIPDIRNSAMHPWREHIRDLAQHPNLACKISGVVAYCDPRNVTVEAIRPFVEHCIECFGWDRVVFGGDWPVCNLASSLGRWVQIINEIVQSEPAANAKRLFSENADRIYRLTA